MKLDPEFKKEWAGALRSGKYKQAQNRLKSILPDGEIGYCCLGVAAILLRDNHEDLLSEHRVRVTEAYNSLLVSELGMINPKSLTDGARAAIGLRWADQVDLFKMNDRDVPFSEIADYIEEKL